MNQWSFWLQVYFYAMRYADENAPVLYSSRIDGMLLPFEKEL